MKQSILIIEDEPGIVDNVEFALKNEGFESKTANSGELGLCLLETNSFSLIILDIGLPDINGFELFKKLKTVSDIPVIFLTARDSEVDKIVGLELGGDDYITKPFSPRELAARVKAVLRRWDKPKNTTVDHFTYGSFSIDDSKKTIYYFKNQLDLSRYEYLILERFIKHPGLVYSRTQLMNLVWDEPEISDERTIDTHIKMIRSKLKSINKFEEPIVTHRGFGYSLKESL